MKEYICSVVGAALIISVAALILPEDAPSSREVKLIGALALLCVMAAPLGSAAARIKDIFADGAITLPEAGEVESDLLGEALERQSAAEIGSVLKSEICRRFGLAEEDVRVTADVATEDGRIVLRRVYVDFTGRAMWQDPRPVREYVESEAGAPCEISEG